MWCFFVAFYCLLGPFSSTWSSLMFLKGWIPLLFYVNRWNSEFSPLECLANSICLQRCFLFPNWKTGKGKPSFYCAVQDQMIILWHMHLFTNNIKNRISELTIIFLFNWVGWKSTAKPSLRLVARVMTQSLFFPWYFRASFLENYTNEIQE